MSIQNPIFQSAIPTNLKGYARKTLWKLANECDAVLGAFYIACYDNPEMPCLQFVEGYAYHITDRHDLIIPFGDGLTGQAARDAKPLFIQHVPEGYIDVVSGLGQGSPKSLLIYPILRQDEVLAVIEIASFVEIQIKPLLDQQHESIANTLVEFRNHA